MSQAHNDRIRLQKIGVMLIPFVAGCGLGFFLREVQATVRPYDTFFVVSALSGQIQAVPPAVLLYCVPAAVLALWFGWGWLLHRKSGQPFIELLERDALSHRPLIVLPLLLMLVQFEALWPLRLLLDPVFVTTFGAVCLLKTLQWTALWPPSNAIHPRRAFLFVCASFLVGTILFAVPGVLQYRAWNVSHLDTGTFEEILWNTLHGRFLYSATYEPSTLGWHVIVTQLLWLPVYALWPSVEWATILQSIALASGVFPLWQLARQQWGDRLALWFSLIYLLQPALHFAAAGLYLNTYRPEAFLVPLVLYAIWFVETDRWKLAAVFAALVLLSREDMAILVTAGGLYVAFAKGRRVYGLTASAAGAAYFVLATMVIIPHFNAAGDYTHTGLFEGLGSSIGEIAANLLLHPGRWLERLFRSNNFFYLCCLLMPMGWASLRRPGLALVAAPLLFPAMLATYSNRASIFMQYHNAPFAVWMAAAVLGGAAFASAWSQRSGRPSEQTRCAVLAFCIGSAAVASVIGSKSLVSINYHWPPHNPFYSRLLYAGGAHTEALERMKALIPRESRVCASFFAATHFTHWASCHLYPKNLHQADYVLVDTKSRFLPEIEESRTRELTEEAARRFQLEGIPGFELLRQEDGVYLFRRHEPRASQKAVQHSSGD